MGQQRGAQSDGDHEREATRDDLRRGILNDPNCVSAKRLFITGASAGIGRATAETLLADGWDVWGTSRAVDRLAGVNGLHPIPMDLCDPASIEAGFEMALQQAGTFDVLINNAGYGVFGPLETMSAVELRRQFETLVFGNVDLIQRVLPGMRERGGGTILNVTSLAAQLPVPFMAPYNAAKAAMSSISASLSLELHGTGIHVIDLQPGDICTGFNHAVTRGAAVDCSTAADRVWMAIDGQMTAAPGPEIVARKIMRLLASPEPLATVGSRFQATVAATSARLLPRRWLLAAIRRYFGLH